MNDQKSILPLEKNQIDYQQKQYLPNDWIAQMNGIMLPLNLDFLQV